MIVTNVPTVSAKIKHRLKTTFQRSTPNCLPTGTNGKESRLKTTFQRVFLPTLYTKVYNHGPLGWPVDLKRTINALLIAPSISKIIDFTTLILHQSTWWIAEWMIVDFIPWLQRLALAVTFQPAATNHPSLFFRRCVDDDGWSQCPRLFLRGRAVGVPSPFTHTKLDVLDPTPSNDTTSHSLAGPMGALNAFHPMMGCQK